MRYDKLVVYYVFDKEAKDYIQESDFLANVTFLGTEKNNQLFGDMKHNRIVVRTRFNHKFRTGRFLIDNVFYNIDSKAHELNRNAFYASEVR